MTHMWAGTVLKSQLHVRFIKIQSLNSNMKISPFQKPLFRPTLRGMWTNTSTKIGTVLELQVAGKKILGMRRRMAMLRKGLQSMFSRCDFNFYLSCVSLLSHSIYQGLFNSKAFAIFQCKPIRVTNSQNLIDLTAELRLLSYGQYFANSFAKRAAAYHVTIPGSYR